MPVTSAKRFGAHLGPGVTEVFGDIRRQSKASLVEANHRAIEEYATLIPEANTGSLKLDRFPFQREPFYSDEIADAEEVVYAKSTQVGATTGMWRWAVRLCDQFGETLVYLFPTKEHVTDFGDERIEPSIEASRYLQGRMPRGGTRRKTMKQIGEGKLILRGMNSKAGVQSIAAASLVFDEYDECDQKNIAQAERRITGAKAEGKIPRIRRLGRPSIPGYGIDAAYQESDRRMWHVTCTECGHEQVMNFSDNLRWRSAAGEDRVLRAGDDLFNTNKDVIEAWRACARCEASLEGKINSGPIFTGRWIATKTGLGRVPGFHIPRFIVPYTDLTQIVKASRETKIGEIEAFHNADLGEAYAAADSRLTDDDLARAMAQGRPGQSVYDGRNPVTMGLDVAGERDLSCRISEHLPDGTRRALAIWEPKDFEEVEQAMERFRVHLAVVDSMPERRGARGMAKNFPGRMYLVEYATEPRADAWVYDEKREIVRVNRTEAIDAMMDSIRLVTNVPLKPGPPKYLEQMKSLVRRVELDTKERPVRTYIATGTQGDDYAHAETYDLVAAELLGAFTQVQQEESQQGEVLEADAPVNLGYGEIGYRGGFE